MRLRIKRWAETFEVSGREIPKKGLRFFGFPVEAEGLGWRRLSGMEDGRGAVFFACFVQMLCATARLDSERRGLVIREDGTPYTPESLYMRFGMCSRETWADAVAFFSDPAIGWLVDEEAPAQAAQPSKVVAMPLPKIEEPSIYDEAAERMIARYVNANAPIDRIPEAMAVSNAIYRKCDERGTAGAHEVLIGLMEDNQQAYIASQPPKMLKTLDTWIASGLSLAARKGPKKYERGTLEAVASAEIEAGRLTLNEARELGAKL